MLERLKLAGADKKRRTLHTSLETAEEKPPVVTYDDSLRINEGYPRWKSQYI